MTTSRSNKKREFNSWAVYGRSEKGWELVGVYRSSSAIRAISRFVYDSIVVYPNLTCLTAKLYREGMPDEGLPT